MAEWFWFGFPCIIGISLCLEPEPGRAGAVDTGPRLVDLGPLHVVFLPRPLWASSQYGGSRQLVLNRHLKV